jgi:uncharacterized protein (DUF2141 family)
MSVIGLFLISFISLPAHSTSSGECAVAGNYALTVTVTGIDKITGHMVVSVYNDPKSFPEYYKEYKQQVVPVTGKQLTCFFTNLPAGDYAVAVFQDYDRDGICNLNWLGFPAEPFGFSNNIRPAFSKPSFRQCKVVLDSDKSVSIRLGG